MIRVRSLGTSSAQKGLWLAQKMSPDTLNHALFMWDVDGELDAAVMDSAFRHVLAEAEVLRVNFVDEDGELRQVPRELGSWRPFFMDLSDSADPEEAARGALADLVGQRFDLENDLLLRLGVVRLSADRSLVVIGYHHLVSDGYGAGGLLSRRIAEVYTALARGSQIPELPHPWDAGSFAAQATGYHASQTFADDLEFWRTYLADAPVPARIPGVALSDAMRSTLSEPVSNADRWSRLADSIGMTSRTLSVPRAEADAWTETAKSMGVWTASLLAAAAAVFFRHRCDRPEFLLSLAVANRAGAAGRTPGLAVNVVPVRAKVPLDAAFTEIADAIVDETYEVFDHTACHYSDIQRASGTVLSGRSGFGVVLNVVEFAEQLRFADSPARHLGATIGAFDELSIGVYTDGSADSDLFIRLDAPAGLYSGAELRVVGEDLIAYIRAVTASPSRPVGALDVPAGAGRGQAPSATGDTREQVPGLTVPELFARQAERDPEAVAVFSGDSAVTYRELDTRSSHLAETLRRQYGVGTETVVAVAMPRSVDLVVALLGVVKAGGAYLPIDPASLADRIRPVAGDSGVRMLLTDAPTAERLSADLGVPTVLFDDLRSRTAGGDGDAAGETRLSLRGDGLLAVMYGCGPTGAVTGVAVTHRNMECFVMDRQWREGGRGTVLWHSPPTSDALPLELWVPLLNGGRVLLAPEGELDVDALTGFRAENGCTTAWLPATLFSAVAAERPTGVSGLREVWTGGDHVSATGVQRVREACPELTVVQAHGPAETTVFAASHRLAPGTPAPHAGVVGRPMDDTALYVLGPGLAPVPVGVTGELYVAGPGVARGRPGRPGATAERFVACPFGPPGGLMYRTGDRVRRGADGLVEYVGLAGAPTEIRGVRVEPAEIEEVLSGYPGLAQSVVVGSRDDLGQQRLVAYAVPAAGAGHEAGLADGLRRFVAERLPEFMVPSVFVVVERLPVTPGGRVDRAALPDPAFDDGRYRAPRNRTEQVLADVFADALELDRVGIDDDFFDLGGNSVRAIRLVGLIRAELNLEVSIRTLFAARTIAGLSDRHQGFARSDRPALGRRTKDGELL
ncbi:AMP-binding protein [Streptomyces sp. NPDC048278]|uniref:non-ribosomal peptide synthetase n=1 Tax=Streptomyces sp. NPDC048278 TaxID=3155809 RepID=UPI00344600A4